MNNFAVSGEGSKQDCFYGVTSAPHVFLEYPVGYMHIQNLYKVQDILLFKEAYALEKIHGTSAHIGWKQNNDQNQLVIFSGGATHQHFRGLFDEDFLKAKFLEIVGNETATVYGEAYGGKLMGMSQTYGTKLKFIVFDVMIRGCWLSVPQAHDFATSLGLEFVHYNKIPTDLASIDAEMNADSVQAIRNGIGTGRIREGVVLRPLMELRKNNDERIMCKHKREEFRETQETRPVVDPAKLKVLEEADQISTEWVTAQRLLHVLDKVPQPHSQKQIPQVIECMVEDVLRESEGEIVKSPEVEKAIKKKTAELFIRHLKS